ncbi:MAG: hypothetical protein Q9170_001215 [Blastenia crenularia]
MVFKPFTHLARQSLGKTFTYGYAQSVVAATQSSYASSTTPFSSFGSHAPGRFSKHGTSHQLHTTFQPPTSSSGITTGAGQQGLTPEDTRGDGGLAAYYEAWQKQQWNNGSGKEWKQFQFPLRIGWKGPNALPDGKSVERDSVRLRPDNLLDRGTPDRAYSSSAVDEIKKAEDAVAEAAAIADVDQAIAQEISSLQITSAPFPAIALHPEPSIKDTSALTSTSPQSTLTRDPTASPSQHSLQFTDSTAITPDSSAFSDSIVQLHESGRYVDIPAAFESLLAKNIRPSLEDYKALLDAAINLTAAKPQVVSKALSVYTSLLRHQITPDNAFYTSLLELLSQQAINVHRTKHAMELRRLRFHSPGLGVPKGESTFLLQSHESEYAILSEDDTLKHAIQIFDAAVATRNDQSFSPEVYRLLVTACALNGRVEEMLRIHSHLEENQVLPVASMFPRMIEAFAQRGDLRSAVECYNGYKSMAIQSDNGYKSLIDRNDQDVYAAVVKSYANCGKSEAGARFFSRITASFKNSVEASDAQFEVVQDTIVVHGLIQHQIDTKEYAKALDIVGGQSLTLHARSKAMARIATAAADGNDKETAVKAYRSIDPDFKEVSMAALSMLALHIRHGELDEARTFWSALYRAPNTEISLIEPTTMYTDALIGRGYVDEALRHAREVFKHMRASVDAVAARNQIKESIDEVIEHIGSFLTKHRIMLPPQVSMNFLWAMSENNGPVSPVSEHLLADFGPVEMSTLDMQDLTLLLRIEAAIISGGTTLQDVAHITRLEHLVDMVSRQSAFLDQTNVELVKQTLRSLETRRPDLIAKWHDTHRMASQHIHAPTLSPPSPNPIGATHAPYAVTYDPYAASIDHRGSNLIVDVLDNVRSKSSANLDEALSRFRSMRRVGRHPRYMVYSKLITAAAKEGRANTIIDLLETAKHDVPLLSQYPSVRDGWSSILDSMIGACLTVGNRAAASEYHQELLQLGSAPTANTFGLYITTLKESAKTLDEANEALNIFCRSQQEGVEPSSFLYNALIGKLGKARRIDDCCFYFSEMRNRGIRPTSVTYGTMINAMCRVSDEWHAEDLFNEMESMPNYKPRPAPYNSLMQFFLSTKRDSSKVSEYYSRMLSKSIRPTMHTYKLLIDTYATLEPLNMPAAEGVLDAIRASGERPEAVHYASLVHAKGCALRDMAGARATFDAAMANPEVRPQACLYQALFESMVANHRVEETEELLNHMASKGVEMTPYIANTLIHGWATARNVAKAQAVYESIGVEKREPSTYEAMTRGFLAGNERQRALDVVHEVLSRGYPPPVTNKIVDLLGPNGSRAASVAPAGLLA